MKPSAGSFRGKGKGWQAGHRGHALKRLSKIVYSLLSSLQHPVAIEWPCLILAAGWSHDEFFALAAACPGAFGDDFFRMWPALCSTSHLVANEGRLARNLGLPHEAIRPLPRGHEGSQQGSSLPGHKLTPPHGGAHVHFDNTKNRWPQGKDESGNYPAIYAVANGVVSRIDTHFALSGGNDRYGLDLTFAKDQTGSACRFCYSIEPMCPEPSEGFYKKFLLVKEGQRVRKGDVIAYLYTPPSSGDGCHIHFHLMIDGKKGFLAPAIFTPEIVKAFHEQCQGFRQHSGETGVPPCMGYRIGAEENPFGTGAKEEL
jgi:hypothetical protein